jgi:MFS transporter, ACS family, D-galactonate transporter
MKLILPLRLFRIFTHQNSKSDFQKSTIKNQSMSTSISRPLWIVLILLVVSVAINYIDRGNLSIAAPLLKTEMKLSPAQLGVLLSAFFWSYALLQILSGWLVDRYNVKWVMAIGFFVWSIATAATGLVSTFVALLLLRVLLGMGESVAYPCYSKIIAENYAEHQRGLANALIDAGTKFGPALGTLAGGVLMARFGWRPLFIVLGLGSLIWIPAWFKWMPRRQEKIKNDAYEEIGFMKILSKRTAWATFMGHFCGNYFWYFLLTWLPFYLVRERGFSMEKMAIIGALAYCVTAISTTITGWLADRAIAAGSSPTRVRKTCTVTGLTFATVVLFVVVIPGSVASMAFLFIACFSYGIFTSSHWAITQTIAGPEAVGKWSGLQNCFANLSGVAAPAITGFVVDKTIHFFWAFVVSAAVVLIGAAVYAFILGPVEPVKWH